MCKPPIRRTSPLGREICDLMLAVNRMYNKSDYIPCIAWGRNAAYAGDLNVGCKLMLEGRIQSREYKKRGEDGEVCTKVAYEVSVIKIEGTLTFRHLPDTVFKIRYFGFQFLRAIVDGSLQALRAASQTGKARACRQAP